MLERAEDDPLLDERHGRRPDLDPEVAPGDHDGVRGAHDRVQLFECLGLLDLGDDVGLRVGRVQELAQPATVGSRAHERQRDVVHAEREGKLEVAQVLLGHRGDRQRDPRDVDTLVRAHRASDRDHPANPLPVRVFHAHVDEPVVDQDLVAGPENLGEHRRHDGKVAGSGRRLSNNVHRVPLDQDACRVEVADPHLRPLEVGDQRQRPAGPLLGLADEARSLAVLLVRAV